MARSLSNAKVFAALVADHVSLVATRRGYATSSASISATLRSGGMMAAKKVSEEPSKNSPWVPDPKTGYYRPENHSNDVDVAELREMLLKNKFNPHH